MKFLQIEPLEARIAPATLSIASNSAFEGNSGERILSFEVTLSEAATETVTVRFATADGTAVSVDPEGDEGADFNSATGMLTFTPGQLTKTIQIEINGDVLAEADEVFNVNLSEASGASIAAGSATGTIKNDARFVISDQSVFEGDSGLKNMQFTVSLVEATPTADAPARVTYNTADDTATLANLDFQAATGELVFVNSDPKTVIVSVVGDTTGEDDEKFFLNLSNPTGASLETESGARAQAVGTIRNDAKFTVGDASIIEGDSGSKKLAFTVSIGDERAPGAASVRYSTSSGTASSSGDFTAVTGALLNFAAGVSTQTAEVTIIGDTLIEAAETFSLTLSESTKGEIADGTAVGTINDNDAVVVVNSVSILEGDNGTSTAVFTIGLKGQLQSGQEVLIDYSTEDVTAISTAGPLQDYIAPVGTAGAPLTVKLDAGAPAKTVSIQVRGDLVNEAVETFKLKLANVRLQTTAGVSIATLANAEGIGSILDNNDPDPTVRILDTVVTEGNDGVKQAQFTVQLSTPLGYAVDVAFETRVNAAAGADPATGGTEAGPGVDYISRSGASARVTIPAGSTTALVTVDLIGDTADEVDETFLLKLLSASYVDPQVAAPVQLTLADDQAVGSVLNDDVLVQSVVPTASSFSEANGTAAGAATFTVTLSQAATHTVVVRYMTEDGTAKAGTDYTGQTSFITIPAGSTTGTISIPLLNDNRDDADGKTFSLKITGVDDAQVSPDLEPAVATVNDDDPLPTVTFAAAPAAVQEGGSATFRVELSTVSDRDVIVPFNVVGVDAIGRAQSATNPAADFILNSGTVTIPAGQLFATFSVSTINDGFDEAATETFEAQLGRNAAGEVAPVVNATIAGEGKSIGTISDNDAAPIVSISTPAAIAEGASGTKVLTFTVSLSTASANTVLVQYATVNGTATAGTDYQALAGEVVFAPNEVSRTVEIVINGDAEVEPDETFQVLLSAPVNATLSTSAGAATGRISADEVNFKIETVGVSTVAEEGTGTAARQVQFKVTRDSAIFASSVFFSTQDGITAGEVFGAASTGARKDFNAVSQRIDFAPNETEKLVTVTILDDNHFEGDEVFHGVLSAPVNGVVDPLGERATFTIQNADARPFLMVGDKSLTEAVANGNFTFEVRLVDAAGNTVVNEREAITVQVATQQITATGPTRATAGSDYAPEVYDLSNTATPNPAITQLVIPAGTQERTVFVKVTNDTRYEDNQKFELRLSEPTRPGEGNVPVAYPGFVTGSELIATGTILNDEAKPFLRVDDDNGGAANINQTITIGEGETKPLQIRLVNAAGALVVSEKQITATVSTQDVSAKAATGDYTSITSQTIVFEPEISVVDVPITALDDLVDEGAETFEVRLATTSPDAVLSDSRALFSITDLDNTPSLVINDVQVIEGDGAGLRARLVVTLSQVSEQEVKVRWSTADGPGEAGAKAAGAFSDYVAASGELVFAPGETSKEIEVELVGDTFRESSESFAVNLASASNATVLDGAGLVTIENGSDTVLGIVATNPITSEGANARATFQIVLSGPAQSNVTVRVATLNGTATAAGVSPDFTAVDRVVTIAEGARSANVEVTITNDTVFERAESFGLQLSQAAFTTPADEPGSPQIVAANSSAVISDDDLFRSADGRTFQWTDVDGDLVTLRISKGSMAVGDEISFQQNVAGSIAGSRQLSQIFLASTGNEFRGASISVRADGQVGLSGDGRVNVVEIIANSDPGDVFASLSGIDLGVVTIDGDLGRITAGDNFTETALARLTVQSLGALSRQANGSDVISQIVGPVGSINIAGDLRGTVEIIGLQYGDLGTLNIGGALKGGTAANSGKVVVTGTLSRAVIGSIEGGAGTESGMLLGDLGTNGNFGSILVKGKIIGGSGVNSGTIFANRIGLVDTTGLVGGTGSRSGSVLAETALGTVVVRGDVIGGTVASDDRNVFGTASGSILSQGTIGTATILGSVRGGGTTESGAIVGVGSITRVNVGGALVGGAGQVSGAVYSERGSVGTVILGNLGGNSIVGGTGANSGLVAAALNIGRVSAPGNVVGGSGSGSGGIEALGGTLGVVTIAKSLIGGDSAGPDVDGRVITATDGSGYIEGVRINSVTITGDIIAGEDSGIGLSRSGSIHASDSIGAVTIRGSVTGTEDVPVVISAGGAVRNLAIGSVQILQNATYLDVIAGLSRSGSAVNADVQITRVLIGGNARAVDIVAGVLAGDNGTFGDSDDRLFPASLTTKDAPKSLSRIAEVLIRGTVEATEEKHGITAQHVVSVRTGSTLATRVPLTAGAANDITPRAVGGETSNLFVREVPLPTPAV